MNVAVVGAGSWGTALSMVLDQNGHAVRMWAREPEIATRINEFHDNASYLPGIALSPSIQCFTSLKRALVDSEIVVFATPSQVLREVALKTKPLLSGREAIVCVAKGIENGTLLLMSQVLTEVLGDCIDDDRIGVLSGPSHAEEVSRFKPTTVVSSAYSRGTARQIQQAFLTPMFRVYINTDIIGVEVASAVKNVIAIAAGIVEGAEFGDNAKAALITRGLAEMSRLGVAMGGHQDTFSGLAGMGDLIVTCTSQHSRNRYVGFHIGKGEKLSAITARMNMIAEGVKTTASVHDLSKKLGIEMPICEAIYDILFEDKNPTDALVTLMTRQVKEEGFFS